MQVGSVGLLSRNLPPGAELAGGAGAELRAAERSNEKSQDFDDICNISEPVLLLSVTNTCCYGYFYGKVGKLRKNSLIFKLIGVT